jgi:hypothetical protein
MVSAVSTKARKAEWACEGSANFFCRRRGCACDGNGSAVFFSIVNIGANNCALAEAVLHLEGAAGGTRGVLDHRRNTTFTETIVESAQVGTMKTLDCS